jgi:DNA-binding LytR/AlgR family response regulator
MDRVAQRLAGHDGSVRLRRSALVNVRAIATLERYDKSAFVVQLRSGTKIISSRFYRPGIRRLLRE